MTWKLLAIPNSFSRSMTKKVMNPVINFIGSLGLDQADDQIHCHWTMSKKACSSVNPRHIGKWAF